MHDTTAPATSLGWDTPTMYGPRGIIALPEVSMTGNVILAVGNETPSGGWHKAAHVVLTPSEADALIDALVVARSRS